MRIFAQPADPKTEINCLATIVAKPSTSPDLASKTSHQLLKKKMLLTQKTPLFKMTKSLFLNQIQAFRFHQNLPTQPAQAKSLSDVKTSNAHPDFYATSYNCPTEIDKRDALS